MFARFLLQIGALIVVVSFVPAPTLAQDAAPKEAVALKEDKTLKKEELDQLLAPIALYPDDLLSNVLMASTYPLEVVQAARWVKEPANAKLKGDALEKALEKQDWDPSVKSLTPFPEVLEMMSSELEWTQKLGDAVLAQEADVMDQIQFLRDKADEAGNLKSNKEQKVTRKSSSSGGGGKYIYIEPASPEVVYVPVYEPTVVYGSWWYPAYPPYYWPPPRGGVFVAGFFWGVGVAIVPPLWGWGRCNWGGRYINVNVYKYNRINVNNPKITSNRWKHNSYHRRGVKYNNNKVRQKYAKGDIRGGKKNRLDYRGHSGKQVLKPKDGDRRPGSRPKPGERPKAGGDKRPGGTKPGERPKAGDKKRPSTADKKRPSTSPKKRPSSGPKKRPSSGSRKRKSNNAFSKPRKSSSARKHASRGRSSMGRSRGGGRRGGGRGGGRRR